MHELAEWQAYRRLQRDGVMPRRVKPFAEATTNSLQVHRQHGTAHPTNGTITDARNLTYRYWTDGSLRRDDA